MVVGEEGESRPYASAGRSPGTERLTDAASLRSVFCGSLKEKASVFSLRIRTTHGPEMVTTQPQGINQQWNTYWYSSPSDYVLYR